MKSMGLLLIVAGLWLKSWYTPAEDVLLLALGLFLCMRADIQMVRAAKEKSHE